MLTDVLDSDALRQQASAAGFARVEDYVLRLIEQDRERIAILQGLEEARAGKCRPFSEFDAEFRQRHAIPSDP